MNAQFEFNRDQAGPCRYVQTDLAMARLDEAEAALRRLVADIQSTRERIRWMEKELGAGCHSGALDFNLAFIYKNILHGLREEEEAILTQIRAQQQEVAGQRDEAAENACLQNALNKSLVRHQVLARLR